MRSMDSLLRYLNPEQPGHPHLHPWNGSKVVLVHLRADLGPAHRGETLTPVPNILAILGGNFACHLCLLLARGNLLTHFHCGVLILAVLAKPLLLLRHALQLDASKVEGSLALIAHHLQLGILLATTLLTTALLALSLVVVMASFTLFWVLALWERFVQRFHSFPHRQSLLQSHHLGRKENGTFRNRQQV